MDKVASPEVMSKIKAAGFEAHAFDDIVKIGKENPRELPVVVPDDILLFSYTSGTTGKPKGSMCSHANTLATMVAIGISFKLNADDVHISYLPLAHCYELCVYHTMIWFGGEIYCMNGDVTKLALDLMEARPTIFVSVPRLYNRFYDLMSRGLVPP